MASRQPTDSPPRKKTKFKCRHCKCPFNTSRGLAVHQNGCAVVPEIRNIHPNNYTAAEFNRDLSSGYVNPHQYRPGLAHNLQLRNIRPIGGQDPPGFHVDDVELECTQQREDVDPSNTISGIQHLDVGEANDDDDSPFQDEDCEPEHATDHNLGTNFLPESNLPSTFKDISMMYAKYKTKVPNEDQKPKERKKQRGEMSITTIALSQLILIVQKHKGGKDFFNELVKYLFEWTAAYPDVFKKTSRTWNRASLLAELAKEFDYLDLVSEQQDVTLEDGRIVTIPVIDFAPQVRDFLDSPFVQSHIADGIDRDTFRVIKTPDEHEYDQDAIVGEKHTGFLYQRGIDVHCPSAPNVDPTLVRPLVIILHIDKSHADLFGNLSVIPIQYSLGIVDIDGQYNIKAWRVLAYIPNLSVGKGSDGAKKAQTGEANRRDFHKCLKVAMSSLLKYYKEGGIWWIDPQGRDVLLKPIIQMIIGDSVGQHELIGHYLSWKARCLGKDCRCSQDRIVRWPCKCRWPLSREIMECSSHAEVFELYDKCGLISYQHLSRATVDDDYATYISKHPLDLVWNELPMADAYLGVVGMTPQEFLHVMGNGNYAHLLIAIREIIGPNTSNSATKGLINKCFVDIKFALEHNSERDISRMSNRKGFFNVASLTSEEIRGNFFGMVMMMHTNYGASLFKPWFERSGLSFVQARTTCLLILSWERFYYDPQRRKDLEKSFNASQRLQKRIYTCIPREERAKDGSRGGARGWKITKWHIMLYMSGIALKFGCLKAVDSGPNERNHKDFLKYHFERTQKQAAKFSTQIAQGEYERMLLEKVRITIQSFLPEPLAALTEPSTTYKYSKTTFERQFFPEEWDDDDNDMYNVPMSDATQIAPSEATGCYMLNLSIGSDRRVTVSHKWKYGKKNQEGKFLPNVMMGKVISDCHLKYCFQYEVDFHSSLVYQCFTAIKANGIIFRSDPDWLGSGHEWYDWIVARFPHTPPPTHRKVSSGQRAGTRGGEKCIARIMGFFRHANGGLPTYNYVERMNFSWSQVEQSGRDTTTYMVLHCSALKFQYRELVRNFVYKFEMTPLTDMYVLPVDCIVGPLAVFPDLVSATEASNRRFMAVLPRHKHGGYWLNYINSPDRNFEVDDDDLSIGSDDTFDYEIDSEEEEDEDEDESSVIGNTVEEDGWDVFSNDDDATINFS